MEDFIHLHVHSQYSLLDGQASVQKMVDKAIGNGMRGMALTDHGNMFGVKDFFDCCNSVNKVRKNEGLELFKPIFGCEVYVARRKKENMTDPSIDRSGNHLILLAKNLNGYRNLIKLVSRAWVDGFYSKPRTDHEDLQRFHEDIICCSACIAGEVPSKILKGDLEGARQSAKWFKEVFGEDYYLELQRHEVRDPKVTANRETFPLQQIANAELIKIARELNIKLVCSNDSHFVNQEDADAHERLLCLSTGKKISEPHMLYTKQEWFKTKEEMNDLFADIPEALSNTVEILDKVETYNLDSDPIMPFFPIPVEFGTEEQWRQKFTEEDLFKEFTSDENGENPLSQEEGEKKIKKLGGYDKLYRIKFEADYLAKLAYEGAKRIYGEPLGKEVDDRIRFELHIMKTMGFPGYFLIVQDFINSARKDLDVWVGPGRGSAAGSVVAYCLGITKLDPLKYDLLFERFLNPDRISLPDIDTDFEDDGRGKVLQWVMDKYGHENCAHIITYGTMATKNSIKDVARVEDLPLDLSNALCKAIPDRLPDGMKMNLKNAISCTPELQVAQSSTDYREANTIKYAQQLEGQIRGTGIHACGFIICRDPISDHVPISTADDPDFPDRKTTVTQYDGHVIESTGLIKMDFLGLKTLSELKEACRVIKEAHGIEIDLDQIPIDDELTYQLYQKGLTVGTFQFESAGMQKYLKELKPTVFEDLIAMNALYRPGPMDYIPSFIRRKNGQEEITYDIPVMEKYLKDTYGITVYQEQVMLLSRLLGGFTRGQSDALRKAMGKKKKAIVDEMKPLFINGGKERGYNPAVLDKIWGDWEKFASYAFNKSHAACYSWVAYQTAYLKAHYPAEFMAALLTRRKDDIKEITKLLDECRNLKIEVLGPDVNESHADFGVNDKQQIRFGLNGIKGLGEAAAASIISEREKNGKYKDIFDFVERVSIPSVKKSGIECLALSGAFDTFSNQISREQFFAPNTRGELFVDSLTKYGNQYQQAKMEAQFSLFGMEAIDRHLPPIPVTERWNDLERLNKERELVGIYLSAHPLDEYSVILNDICNLHMEQMNDLTSFENQDVRLGGIVTGLKRQGITKTNQPYGIVMLEDYTGSAEIALFGNDWAQWKGYLTQQGNLLYITGKVQGRQHRPEIMELKIGKIEFLPEVKDQLIQSITITIDSNRLASDDVAELCKHIQEMQQEPEGKEETAAGIDVKWNICESGNTPVLHMKSKAKCYRFNKKLIDFLCSTEYLTYKIN